MVGGRRAVPHRDLWSGGNRRAVPHRDLWSGGNRRAVPHRDLWSGGIVGQCPTGTYGLGGS